MCAKYCVWYISLIGKYNVTTQDLTKWTYLYILVKFPFHSAYFSKSVLAVSSKLTRERAQKSWWHNTNMRYFKSKIAFPENPKILTCDVVLPNERIMNLPEELLQNQSNLARNEYSYIETCSEIQNRKNYFLCIRFNKMKSFYYQLELKNKN